MQEVSSTTGRVIAVCRNPEPGLPKPVVAEVRLVEDWGVEGDYHAGKFVRHRYLAKKYPTRRNVRQVLLVDAAAYAELAEQGRHLEPGMMGENITIAGLAIMHLSPGTQLTIGEALLEITEVRKPCKQLNGVEDGLMKAVTARQDGHNVYKAGIMTRVLKGGRVQAGDRISILA